MELVTGGELLGKILKYKHFSEDVARKYFVDLIHGLEYCHVNNIVHRDLKPQNLLLDDKDRLKITDFGLSTLTTGAQSLTTPCGTVAYMAPEVRAKRKYKGFLVDIWSCGVILYTMLAGKRPHMVINIINIYKH